MHSSLSDPSCTLLTVYQTSMIRTSSILTFSKARNEVKCFWSSGVYIASGSLAVTVIATLKMPSSWLESR